MEVFSPTLLKKVEKKRVQIALDTSRYKRDWESLETAACNRLFIIKEEKKGRKKNGD
jgi:hypothetical protein